MSSTRSATRTASVAIRAVLVFTLVLGVGYTALITGIGQLFLPWQANGSPVYDAHGSAVGSALLGQSFTDADGNALPQYFQSRPSAAGAGYDGGASSGSNLGPESSDLIGLIGDRQASIAEREGVDVSAIPADAVTASGSGLDPHISPEYALLQVPRIASARGIDESVVQTLVDAAIEARDLGFLGQPRVNVLQVNVALDALP